MSEIPTNDNDNFNYFYKTIEDSDENLAYRNIQKTHIFNENNKVSIEPSFGSSQGKHGIAYEKTIHFNYSEKYNGRSQVLAQTSRSSLIPNSADLSDNLNSTSVNEENSDDSIKVTNAENEIIAFLIDISNKENEICTKNGINKLNEINYNLATNNFFNNYSFEKNDDTTSKSSKNDSNESSSAMFRINIFSEQKQQYSGDASPIIESGRNINFQALASDVTYNTISNPHLNNNSESSFSVEENKLSNSAASQESLLLNNSQKNSDNRVKPKDTKKARRRKEDFINELMQDSFLKCFHENAGNQNSYNSSYNKNNKKPKNAKNEAKESKQANELEHRHNHYSKESQSGDNINLAKLAPQAKEGSEAEAFEMIIDDLVQTNPEKNDLISDLDFGYKQGKFTESTEPVETGQVGITKTVSKSAVDPAELRRKILGSFKKNGEYKKSYYRFFKEIEKLIKSNPRHKFMCENFPEEYDKDLFYSHLKKTQLRRANLKHKIHISPKSLKSWFLGDYLNKEKTADYPNYNSAQAQGYKETYEGQKANILIKVWNSSNGLAQEKICKKLSLIYLLIFKYF